MSARTMYKKAPELIEAFLEEPLPKDLYKLSRFGKVDPPWTPPGKGAGPEEYAQAWTEGYDGGPIRGAFRWLGQAGLEECLSFLPKNLRKRGRAPKARMIEEFEDLPEAERLVKSILRHGAAMHDIQELLFGFRDIWTDLDGIRPDTWAVEDLIEILSLRNARGKAVDPVPASFIFLWNSSDEPYHARQIEKAERLLVVALKEVMPGKFG
ncbi:MAG: hypothetical protein HKN12_01100 [Gemmatimonadetes bacterium]|nr:hypothetical protein [Gemmatimonadota bacterium]